MKQSQNRKTKKHSKRTKHSTKHRSNGNSNSNKLNGGGVTQSILDRAQDGSLINNTVDYMKNLRDALVGKESDKMLFLESSYKLLSLARSNALFPLLEYDDIVNIMFTYFHKIEPETYYVIDDVKKFIDACIHFQKSKEQNNNNIVNVVEIDKYTPFLLENNTIIEKIDFTPFSEALTIYLDARTQISKERMEAYQLQQNEP